MNQKIQVRRYQSDDAEFLSKIYYNTIHTINAKDYTPEQLEAWAPWSSVQDYSGWQEKLEKIKPYVAVIQSIIVGFAEFEPNGHIDCFYVHHEFQGCGVGTTLIRAIEQEASDKRLSRIYAEVSITAKPFFERKGFNVVKQQTVTIRGVELTNFIMEKVSQVEPKNDNRKDVYKIYEKIAHWMDEHRSRILFEKPYLDRVISYLKPGAEVLDLGCGTGEPIGQYFVDAGFQVTGVDASTEMLKIAQSRCPKIKFILGDMRNVILEEKFDCIIAWHSFFHLSQDDQREMFKIFSFYLKKDGLLLFTTGPEAGEVWSNNGGENLYHASLAPNEYKILLEQHGFIVLEYKISDRKCGDATVWMAKFRTES